MPFRPLLFPTWSLLSFHMPWHKVAFMAHVDPPGQSAYTPPRQVVHALGLAGAHP